MLFGSLDKHSSFLLEELLVVSFPSLFSLAEQNLCLLQGFGVAAKDRWLGGVGKDAAFPGKPDVFGRGLVLG